MTGKEDIIKAARLCNVPDLSCSPEGELMPWVVAFYKAAYNAGVMACVDELDSWDNERVYPSSAAADLTALLEKP